MLKPRIMFYHDGRHPLIYMYEPPMQKQEYEAAVDELLGTPVEALMFCLGDGRTVLHDTKVGELWGSNVERWGHEVFHRAHQNAVALIEQGHDPLRIVCDRAHARGMLLYPVLLVQQGRGTREDDMRCSEFRFNNQHLEIGAAGDLPPDYSNPTFLDFKHPEVRKERLALIEETVQNYSIDGFELQLNYGGNYFHPNEIDAGRLIMTEWIGQVYELVKGSGPDRELAICVPANVEGGHGIGLDVRRWIKDGIVDVIIGQTLAGPELIDPTADFRDLVAAARGSSCRIHAAIHSHLDSDRMGEAPIEMIRATACNYWDQGVDGLCLAHWFGNWPYSSTFYEKTRELPYAEVMSPRDKFYYVPTSTSSYPEPPCEVGRTLQLPTDLVVGTPVSFMFNTSDDLPRWDAVGRVHEVLLRVRLCHTSEADQIQFEFNGDLLPASCLRKINHLYRMSGVRYRVWGYWYVFPLDRDHWPRRGENELKVTLLGRDPNFAAQIFVRDIELETKYLMGVNYHRGHDRDVLGPHEHDHA